MAFVRSPIQKRSQRGAVLIISLVILTVLTIVVLSANRGVVVQERMTAAIRESNITFQAAESGLVEAEAFVDDIPGLGALSDAGVNGLYSQNSGPADYSDPAIWAPGITQLATETAPGYETRFFVEYIGQAEIEGAEEISVDFSYGQAQVVMVVQVFRVVVRSVGPNGQPQRIIAGYYSSFKES